MASDKIPTIYIDTREQQPWTFTKSRPKCLAKWGCDYSAVGYLGVVGIERKSWSDYVGSISNHNWPRFQRSLTKLLKIKRRCVIVEGYPTDYTVHSGITTRRVLIYTAKIMAVGIPVLFARDRIVANEAAILFFKESCR